MEDREFFDELYQMWSRTTGASDRYWMPQEYEDHSGRWSIYAVGQDNPESTETNRKLVASSVSDKDADFITAVHGCLPDLVRRLGSAIDESDRLDEERDEQEVRIAQLEIETEDLTGKLIATYERIKELERERDEADAYFRSIDQENCRLNDELEHAKAEANRWKYQ